ncbi:MAG TPA: histidine kinase [Burkholderiales bacterium]
MVSLESTSPGFGRPGPVQDEESVDARMVAFMRCLLAASALVVIYIDPSEPARLVELTYACLSAYLVYAIALATLIWWGKPLLSPRASHWVDVLCYAGLIGLTEGTSSIFFQFFFFAILVASFSYGFKEGQRVTAASAVLFIVVGLAATPPASGFELDRTLIRPVMLFLLGYMIAYWGGHELALRRRLRLLRKVSRVANPRLGIDHALVESLRRLVEFYNADLGFLVRAPSTGAPYLLYRIQARSPQQQAGPETLSESTARLLMEMPPRATLAYGPRKRPEDADLAAQCARVANLLGTPHFITAPYREHEGLHGRIYIAGKRSFSYGEADFLAQAAEQTGAAIDNLALLDKLMANAAQLERMRIARDLHDTTIQPYIGLRLGLQALQRKVPPDSSLAGPVTELLGMTSAAVEDLRGYVRKLRDTHPHLGTAQLIDTLHDQIARYRSFYAIDVELRAEPHLSLSDQIADEAYQIVCEALSNIYRHTRARKAYVELKRDGESLRIEVGNGRQPGASARFTPRSITERAKALGGAVDVRLDAGGLDVVVVQIPL